MNAVGRRDEARGSAHRTVRARLRSSCTAPPPARTGSAALILASETFDDQAQQAPQCPGGRPFMEKLLIECTPSCSGRAWSRRCRTRAAGTLRHQRYGVQRRNAGRARHRAVARPHHDARRDLMSESGADAGSRRAGSPTRSCRSATAEVQATVIGETDGNVWSSPGTETIVDVAPKTVATDGPSRPPQRCPEWLRRSCRPRQQVATCQHRRRAGRHHAEGTPRPACATRAGSPTSTTSSCGDSVPPSRRIRHAALDEETNLESRSTAAQRPLFLGPAGAQLASARLPQRCGLRC